MSAQHTLTRSPGQRGWAGETSSVHPSHGHVIGLDAHAIAVEAGCIRWGDGNSVGGDPVSSDPVGGDPTGGDSAGGDPAGGDPAGGDPAGGDPAGGDPAGGDPAGSDPAGGDPAGGDPAGAKLVKLCRALLHAVCHSSSSASDSPSSTALPQMLHAYTT